MITYILIALGSVFAIIGIILFIKKIGSGSSKVTFLGAQLETGNSSLIIFIVGAALIAFGATVNRKSEPVSSDPTSTAVVKGNGTDSANKGKDSSAHGKDTSVHSTNNTENTSGHDEKDPLLAYFTLSAGEPHVMNDLQITLTLPMQVPSAVSGSGQKAVKIRIWRNITHPVSDTAVLDPGAGNNGVEMQLFVLNTITPVSITDVGQYKFYVYNPFMIGNYITSVQVKMYKN